MSAIAKLPEQSAIESIVINGDLKTLTPEQRVAYYGKVCDALGLAYSRAFCRGHARWQTAPLSVSPCAPKPRDTGSPSQAPTRRMPVKGD